MFISLWQTVKHSGYPLHSSLKDLGVSEYPYSINYVIRRRMQIDSFMELPEDKRPPKAIWDKPNELNEWFDRIKSGAQTEFSIPLDDIEG